MSGVNSAINNLNNSVESFQSQVDVHVNNVDASTRKVQEAAETVYKRVEQFRSDIMHGEEKQIAHENIMRIDQVIKEQFGNYDAIRKTIIGVVRDFDINLVRNSTIEELSEELWITSSRYWLSYALLAITAWVNNYPEVAKNALSETVRKDEIKASLFFTLLNLRFDRIQTAREWFKVYCRTLNPVMLQQETAVMIQAFMGGLFGKDKQLEHDVNEIINEWIRIISEDAKICEELVNRYENYFENSPSNTKCDYQMIKAFCTNYQEVETSFLDVSKYDNFLRLMDEMSVEQTPQTDENYKSRVDAVLNSLITNYDEEERELREEQQYYRFIIDNEGDKQKAQKQFEEVQSLRKEGFNFGKQMVDWAVYSDPAHTDVYVRQFGLRGTKDWFQSALENWTVKLRKKCPLQYHLSIDGWSSTSNGRDLDDQRTAVTNYFENNKFNLVCVNAFNIALLIVFFISLIVTVAGVVQLINSGFNYVVLVGAGLMLLSVLILVIRILSALKKFQERVNTAVFNLEGTMAQIVEFQRYFTENIRKKDDIVSKLNFI